MAKAANFSQNWSHCLQFPSQFSLRKHLFGPEKKLLTTQTIALNCAFSRNSALPWKKYRKIHSNMWTALVQFCLGRFARHSYVHSIFWFQVSSEGSIQPYFPTSALNVLNWIVDFDTNDNKPKGKSYLTHYKLNYYASDW